MKGVHAMNECSRKIKMLHFLMALAIAMSLPRSAATQPPPEPVSAKSPYAIPNEYIVVLRTELPKARVEPLARELSTAHHGKLEKVWTAALNGFFIRMTAKDAEAMRQHPEVRAVEENTAMFFSSVMPTNVDPATCDLPTQQNCATETDNRLWHLDSLEQDSAIPTHTFSYCTDGSDVTVYVVDTGVVGQHSEFLRADGTSRVEEGYNASGDGYPANDPCLGGFAEPAEGLYVALERGYRDGELLNGGHGTAVASLVAGKKVGVAKNARLVPVKVARCDQHNPRHQRRNRNYAAGAIVFKVNPQGQVDGTFRAVQEGTTGSIEPVWPTQIGGEVMDGTVRWQRVDLSPSETQSTKQMLIDGIDWILSQAIYPLSPAVVTFSTFRLLSEEGITDLNTPSGDTSFQEMIRRLDLAGITVVASANNQNGDACNTAPGAFSRRNPDAALRGNVITVGGTMIINNPDRIDPLEVPPNQQANGGWPAGSHLEPGYDRTQATRYGRWVCGDGDSDPCSLTPPPPPSSGQYKGYIAGSNGGRCVTLFAPAKNVSVAGIASANDYRDPRRRNALASGTSWSAPIVTGIVARMLQRFPSSTPQEIHNLLMANANYDELDLSALNPPDVTGTPNILLHVGDVRITDQPDSSPASAGSPAVLSVSATADLPPAYQWFEVNADFNYLLFKRGAAAAVPIPGATSSTLSVTPSTRKAYFVRVTSCGSSDSDIAVVVPTPAAPTGFTAQRNSSTGAIDLSWNTSPGAESYQIDRKVSNGSWEFLVEISNLSGGPVSTTYSDSTAPSGVVIEYRIRAGAGRLYLGQHTWSAYVLVSVNPPPTCPHASDLNLSNQTINTTQIFEACHTITAGTDFVVGPSGNVTLHAMDWVALRPGFKISVGGQLKVVVP